MKDLGAWLFILSVDLFALGRCNCNKLPLNNTSGIGKCSDTIREAGIDLDNDSI